MSGEMKKTYFNLQIPTELIRDRTFDSIDFVVYAKLIQLFYLSGQKKVLSLDAHFLTNLCGLKDIRRLKLATKELVKRKMITSEIDNIPRNGLIEVEILDPFGMLGNRKGNEVSFAQLPFIAMDRKITHAVGHIGVRMLYYYKSFINDKQHSRRFCFTARETISKDVGISIKTVDRYNLILEKLRFIKIVRHKLESTGEWTKKNEREVLTFNKFNNHYFIRMKNIEKYYDKHQF